MTTTAPMIPVVDCSRHQGAISFTTMASRGVKGVICRAGNGTTPDDAFDRYIPAARAAGLETGAYWFCNPRVGTAQQQGLDLAAAHDRQHCTLPPMLDVESFELERKTLPAPTPAQFAAWLRTMATTTERQTRRPFFYSNRSFWDPHVGDATFGDYDLIVARYPFYSDAACAAHVPPVDAARWEAWIMAETKLRPQVPTGWTTCAGWQFSAGYNGRGPVYGVSSDDLDLNIVRADVWARWLGHTTPTPEIPRPTPQPPHSEPGDDDMAEMIERIYTNSEQFFADGPGVVKFILMGSGKLRHLEPTEWKLRGSVQGEPLTNAQIGQLGVVSA